MTNVDQALFHELLSKHQVQEQLNHWTRGADRIDIDEMRSAFHPNAHIDYGFFDGTVEEFLPWVVRFHSEDLVSTTHTISSVLVKVSGETAGSESRVECCLRFRHPSGGELDLLLAGRYLDKWERREGVWRIADRTALVDHYRTLLVERDAMVEDLVKAPIAGKRSKDDLSYQYV
jgi:hypothetical protein